MNLQSLSKALAGAIVTAVVAYLAKHNVVLGADAAGALNMVIAAVIGFVGVYLAPRNK
jgi:hypothetical protein